MAEYLAPGVYVEETSFRSKSIEGVSTSTTAFVGPTASGPTSGLPELLTSYADYERIYGGFDDFAFSTTDARMNRNYIAHAVQNYFNNGGARLYVQRVASSGAAAASSGAVFPDTGTATVYFVARSTGASFNGAAIAVQQTALPVNKAALGKLPDGSVVRIHTAGTSGTTVELWIKDAGVWKEAGTTGLTAVASADVSAVTEAYLIQVDVEYRPVRGSAIRYEGLAAGKGHPRYIGTVLAVQPTRRADQLSNPIALKFDTGGNPNGIELLTGLVGTQPAVPTSGPYVEPHKSFTLSSGSDGSAPSITDYANGFEKIGGLEDISIVAAPGYSVRSTSDYTGIQGALLTHVEKARRYQIAVLDSPPDQTPSTMRTLRGLVDSTRAAMYYPWLVATNPAAGPNNDLPTEVDLPPSGFICGIYARTDIERGVHKAPANEVIRGMLRLERNVNHGEQELLNPIGVNCLRLMAGRGFRVWGARTISSDPEWKYVNIRRYFNYLEASIDRGTQWAVFEPNGEMLWANVRNTIGDFLFNEWKNGALLGGKPEEAFFVRCDRTTMTQNDLDNGRLICLIGVAAIKPAEFVIFRIGQKTADAKG